MHRASVDFQHPRRFAQVPAELAQDCFYVERLGLLERDWRSVLEPDTAPASHDAPPIFSTAGNAFGSAWFASSRNFCPSWRVALYVAQRGTSCCMPLVAVSSRHDRPHPGHLNSTIDTRPRSAKLPAQLGHLREQFFVGIDRSQFQMANFQGKKFYATEPPREAVVLGHVRAVDCGRASELPARLTSHAEFMAVSRELEQRGRAERNETEPHVPRPWTHWDDWFTRRDRALRQHPRRRQLSTLLHVRSRRRRARLACAIHHALRVVERKHDIIVHHQNHINTLAFVQLERALCHQQNVIPRERDVARARLLNQPRAGVAACAHRLERLRVKPAVRGNDHQRLFHLVASKMLVSSSATGDVL